VADALKNKFGMDVPRRIGATVRAVHRSFPLERFVREVARGYDALELMPRARHIARALRTHLPARYAEALDILMESIGPARAASDADDMPPFLYLPHTLFVAEYGLDDFEPSMCAQYELTQRFTAEFSIRPFLAHHTERTLERLAQWAHDDSVHVRRLVSEGTRPRLPWAMRLRAFQKDPRPVLALLEQLKDDPELYVRRSVANNLNDVGKDHPGLLLDTARRWLHRSTARRRWIVERGLRSLVKQCDAKALALLGYGRSASLTVSGGRITPKRVAAGASVSIAFEVANAAPRAQRVLADFSVHFVKASGKAAPKVFKLKSVTLSPGESALFGKSVSLKQMTTRIHHPGRHVVHALVNGVQHRIGHFDLTT
jgi:3-methyladenine DNA glycosylase AlkC